MILMMVGQKNPLNLTRAGNLQGFSPHVSLAGIDHQVAQHVAVNGHQGRAQGSPAQFEPLDAGEHFLLADAHVFRRKAKRPPDISGDLCIVRACV